MLSKPSDIAQFAVEAEIIAEEQEPYYCDGGSKHPHARETIFSLLTHAWEPGERKVQCRECGAIYAIPDRIPKIVRQIPKNRSTS